MKKKEYTAPMTTAVNVQLQQMIALSGGDNPEGVGVTGNPDDSPSTDPNRSRYWDDDWYEDEE